MNWLLSMWLQEQIDCRLTAQSAPSQHRSPWKTGEGQRGAGSNGGHDGGVSSSQENSISALRRVRRRSERDEVDKEDGGDEGDE